MQKHVNLVDLVKTFPTNIFLHNLASIQKRTSPIKIAHLAEKSENGSISNFSTKADPGNAFIPLNGEQMSCANAMLTCAREQDCLTYYNKYHEPDLGSCGDFQQWAWDAGCCPDPN